MSNCMKCAFRTGKTCSLGHKITNHCDDFGDGTKRFCQHQLDKSPRYGTHIVEASYKIMMDTAKVCKCND